MYQDYFGIEENPFSLTPDPRYLFMTEGHQEALAHLLYGVSEGGGFVLLTGEVGTGKTSVCRCLLEQLPAQAEVALVLNPRLDEIELLATVFDELGIKQPETSSLKTLVDGLNQHLLRLHAEGRHAVLIIDEAQSLRPTVLEQVRLLTNLETDKRKLLQIILIGQPELDEILNRRELRQLAQRITSRAHLEPLSAMETSAYMTHRLEVAGLGAEIFTRRARAEVYTRSGGIPRLINSLCDRCLLAAFAKETKQVDRKMVRKAAAEVLGRHVKSRASGWKILPWAVATATATAAAAVIAVTLIGLPDLWRSAEAPGISIVAEAVQPPQIAADQPAASGTNAAAPEQMIASEAAPGEATSGLLTGSAAVAAPVVTEHESAAPPVAETAPLVAEAVPPVAEPVPPAAETAPPAAEAVSPVAEVAPPVAEIAPPVAEAAPLVAEAVPPVAEAAPLTEETGSNAVSTAVQTAILPQAEGRRDEPPKVAASERAEPMPTISLGQLFALDQVTGDKEAALARLFGFWQRDYGALPGREACDKAREGGLLCLRGKKSLPGLIALNRPALLTLESPNGEWIHVVLTGVDGTRMTLEVGFRRVRARAMDLAAVWSGEFLLLWQPPEIYQRPMKQGHKGADVAWLKNRFAELAGGPNEVVGEATFDSDLKAQVIAFQRSRPLSVDGIVGPQTLVHLNNAVGATDVAVLATGP
jgi:general secretion pathway protein A